VTRAKLSPLPLWEREARASAQGEGSRPKTLLSDPSPGSQLALLATLSHKSLHSDPREARDRGGRGVAST
jgi:hypothetical protein